MPNKIRKKWQRPFNWPPSTWEFTAGMQWVSEVALAFVFVLVIFTIISAAILWPVLLLKTFQHVISGTADEVRNSLLAVAALIGVPFLIWRTLIASKQTNISREGHYTALFTKAVEQLGADKVVKRREFKPHYATDAEGNVLKEPSGNAVLKLSATGEVSGDFASYEVTTTNYEVRLGAIYALERIVQDSDRDAWPIYLTLCSYVQNNAHPTSDENGAADNSKRNNSDIEEIFNVLDRYKGERDVDVVAFFENIHLPNIRLLSGGFRQAVFSKCFIDSVVVRAGAALIEFDQCYSESLDVRQAVMEGTSLQKGNFKKIIVNDCSWENLQIDTKCDRAMLLGSHFNKGHINIETKELILAESEFTDIIFGSKNCYDPHPWRIGKNVFRNCRFIEVNFTLSDLSQADFQSCRFERCCFVRSTGLVLEGNEFLDCFTDADYNPGTSSPYPNLDLQFQWSAWKNLHAND